MGNKPNTGLGGGSLIPRKPTVGELNSGFSILTISLRTTGGMGCEQMDWAD